MDSIKYSAVKGQSILGYRTTKMRVGEVGW